jgi:spermidine synthase
VLHVVLVPRFGVGGALAALAGCGAVACASWVARPAARGAAAAAALACAGLAVLLALAPEPALASPKLVDPALTVRAFREDRHFAATVVDDGLLGERTLLTDQFRAAGTGRDYRYMRVLGHLPLALHPSPRNVAVLALGTGTTLGAVALHPEVERIDVLEISRAVVDFAPWFEAANRGALDGRDARVRVLVDDGRRTLATQRGQYDVLTMEPLLPDSPFGVYLYTPEFYAIARRSLRPGGIVCQWIPPHALEPEVFVALLEAFGRAFPSAHAWLFGTQLILIGSDGVPSPREIAAGAELRSALRELGLDSAAGVRSRWVCDLRSLPDSQERALRDSDPWIAWRRKPDGAQVLEWLPINLERVASAAERKPWPEVPGDAKLAEALRALRHARVALGASEFELRRGQSSAEQARERSLAALGGLDREQLADPEVRAFVDEVEFLFALRDGVSKLARGAAREALEPLVRAAELRSERADVHGYVAAALIGAGQREAARAALRRALEACPKLAATPAGARLAAFGVPADWLAPPPSVEIEHAPAVLR